jgi:hypothetical protein
MPFRLRTFALVVVGTLAAPTVAAPVPQLAAKYDPPTVVGQLASGQRMLDEIKGFMKAMDPRMVEEFDKGLTQTLGQKGFAGIDLKKPAGMFAYIKPKLEHSYIVFVVPTTGEKEALDLIERLQFGVEEEKSQKNLYRLRKRFVIDEDVPVRVRFHDGHAYLAVNADADELENAKLIPIGALVDDKEKAPLAATLFINRVPKELKDLADGALAEGRRNLAQLDARRPPDMPLSFPPLFKEMLDWSERNWATMVTEGDTLTFRVAGDAKGGEYATALSLTPKAKTQLATDVAAVKPANGRFHQLTTKDAVGGAWLTLPVPPKAFREKAAPFAADMLRLAEKETNEPFKAVIGEVAKAAEAALNKGEFDAGFAILGPDKDGLYTGVAAVAVPDPAALGKVVKDTVKDLPKEVQGLVKIDAEKAGDLTVHVFNLPEVPEELQKLLGKNPEVRVAFGGGAVFAAIGPGGLEQIKRAAALKPAAVRALDVQVNPAKLNKLLGDNAPAEVGTWFGTLLGKDDALRSQFSVDIRGGSDLTVSWSQFRLGIFVFGAARAIR